MSNLPTPEEALRRFEKNPEAAAAFDRATRRERPECKTRREAIVACINDLASLKTKESEAKALRAKVVAAKAEIARLERVKAAIPQLKEKVATAKSKLTATKTAKAAAPAPAPAKAENAMDTYRRLQRTDPVEAMKYWTKNREDILNFKKTFKS